ncbi:MAG: glycosyltransferase family 1 protein, partial [Limisphaerales bacterium]
EGFAGISQETRLLFRGLRKIQSVEVEGMLQTSNRFLARGTSLRPGLSGLFGGSLSQPKRYKRFSNVIVSMTERPYDSLLDIIIDWLKKRSEQAALQASVMTGLGKIKLSRFESESFQDFTWRTLFAKTLPASDFSLVAPANHLVCSVPWNTLHKVGLASLNWRATPKYPELDTAGIDIFIGQTPYPARISRGTAMVIRYHDALPVFMPHTIPNKSEHQSSHFYALMNNVKCGAWFACVSEATRQDLIKLFPEAKDKAVTIHNMVSHNYFIEELAFERVL